MLQLLLTDKQVDAANAYGEWLRLAVHEQSLPANDRVRASASCLAIAQDHHHAIVVLLASGLYGPSFALLRLAFEAYVRGEWLALCASNEELKRFLRGHEPPKINRLIEELERTEAFKEQALSHVKRHTWRTMCSYTHTGGLQVQRWNTVAGIEPNYSREEVLEVLRFADIIASLAVLGVVTIMGDEGLGEAVLRRFKARMMEC